MLPPQESALRTLRPPQWFLIALLLALAYWGLALRGPISVGAWQDDAIYLATAKALASGEGYRHLEIPGAPPQSKYPPLYPALLSLVWRAAPDYPQNLRWLLLPGALSAAALVALSIGYWRRCFAAGRVELCCIGALAALSPSLLSMLRFAMSDLLYAALALGGIALLDAQVDARRAPRADEPGAAAAARFPARLLGAALCVAAAIWTRSIGVSIALGGAAFLAWRGLKRDAVVFAAATAALVAPWWLQQLSALAPGAGAAPLLLLESELDYASWRPHELSQLPLVAFQNLFKQAFGLLYFELALPQFPLLRALADGGGRNLGLHALAWTLAGLLLLGFAASARRGLRALHVCAALYAALMLAYPGDPFRFALPWAPFLLYFLARGITTLATAGAQALCLLALPLFLFEAWTLATPDPEAYPFRTGTRSFAELQRLEDWVRANTQPEDVIASGDFAALYLATGRRGYYLWPILDPIAQYYGGGRGWRSFYILPGEATDAALDAETEAQLANAYREAGVDWYIDNARPDPMTQAVRRYVERHPQDFEALHTTPGREYRVYRVRAATSPGSDSGRRSERPGSAPAPAPQMLVAPHAAEAQRAQARRRDDAVGPSAPRAPQIPLEARLVGVGPGAPGLAPDFGEARAAERAEDLGVRVRVLVERRLPAYIAPAALARVRDHVRDRAAAQRVVVAVEQQVAVRPFEQVRVVGPEALIGVGRVGLEREQAARGERAAHRAEHALDDLRARQVVHDVAAGEREPRLRRQRERLEPAFEQLHAVGPARAAAAGQAQHRARRVDADYSGSGAREPFGQQTRAAAEIEDRRAAPRRRDERPQRAQERARHLELHVLVVDAREDGVGIPAHGAPSVERRGSPAVRNLERWAQATPFSSTTLASGSRRYSEGPIPRAP